MSKYEADNLELPNWYKNQFLVSKEEDLETFSTPESVYFALRFRSELLKLVSDKVVFCLYNREKNMKRIKDGIDEMIDLSWDFRIK